MGQRDVNVPEMQQQNAALQEPSCLVASVALRCLPSFGTWYLGDGLIGRAVPHRASLVHKLRLLAHMHRRDSRRSRHVSLSKQDPLQRPCVVVLISAGAVGFT